jgi:hypothetical protein
MNGSLKLIAPLAAALAIAACNSGGSSNIPSAAGPSQTTTTASSPKHFVPEWQAKHEARRACKELAGGVQCQVLLVTKGVRPLCSPSGGSCGLRPIDLQTRYNLGPSLGNGSGQVVALIELGDLSSAASDLATYRSTFGLGTAPFNKYNQYGEQYDYPESCEDFGWCLETDLDIEMVAAACPKCTIDLIEGGNCGGVVCGLEGAETAGVDVGATILSNSWGCHTGVYGNNCGDPNFPSYFSTPGIAYLASSGDSGYPEIEYPAALVNVLAVGGTRFTRTARRIRKRFGTAPARAARRSASHRGSTTPSAAVVPLPTSRHRPVANPELPPITRSTADGSTSAAPASRRRLRQASSDSPATPPASSADRRSGSFRTRNTRRSSTSSRRVMTAVAGTISAKPA